MKKFIRLFLVTGALVSLLLGCSKADKPMPITKENITKYMQNAKAAVRSTNPKEFEEAKNSPVKQKEMLYKSIIEPMEKMGYSYDKTVYDIADKIILKKLVTTDATMVTMIRAIIDYAIIWKEVSLANGFISKETKGQLEKVNLLLPH